MNTKTYEPLREKIGHFNELSIEVFYSLGGMNYFSGNVSRRGVYLLLKPVGRSGNGFEESMLMGGQRECGYKILLEELPRKSQKVIDKQFTKVEPLTKQIANLYFEDKTDEIVQLVK